MLKRENNITPAVAILTNFQEFNPGYSLTGIVVDQANMLAREGHRVVIYVNEKYNPNFEEDCGLKKIRAHSKGLIQIKAKTKFAHLKDYESIKDLTPKHKQIAEEAGKIFAEEFIKENISIAFTHDFIFTGWNLVYAEAVKRVDAAMRERMKPVRWLHWVHSVPSNYRDWWDLESYGKNHEIVFPNKTEIMRVAEGFKTTADRVRVIPHIKDIRTWYDFGDDAMSFTEKYPSIIHADVLQVYPCSTDRMSAKQLDLLIKMFAFFKSSTQTLSVCLIVANQWATGRQRKEDVHEYIKIAEDLGLEYGTEIIFTSEADEKYATGISKRMLRELQLLTNLFIFPTKEESFGLVGPEAAYSGALTVINKSLTMQFEVMSEYPPAFDFGSFHQINQPIEAGDDGYINAVAQAVLHRLYKNEAGMTKLYCRKRYNMDYVYERHYMPAFY